MKVYFNDLTLASTAEENGVFLPEFLNLKKEFFAELKSKKKECGAFLIANDEGMAQLGVAFGNRPELMPYLYSCVGRAFQEEAEKDNDHLLETQYTLKESNQKCDMMGLSQRENSFTLGLNSTRFWQQLVYPIEKETLDGSSVVDAICITQKNQITSKIVQDQIKVADGGRRESGDAVPKPLVKKRIIVVGVHDRGMLMQILQDLRLDSSRFEFIETAEVANFDCTRWRNSNSIAALMVGAVPHKAAGMGDATSVLDALRKQPGYPHVETLTETMEEKVDANTGDRFYVPAGELNITKRSFRCGLMNLMVKGLL